jgi:tRNA 2-thiouridine synthesizing protein A
MNPAPSADSASAPPHDLEVDASGLNCPLPILKAKKALSALSSGQVLKLVSTDPGSRRDFEAFARQTGNALLAMHEQGSAWAFYLQRR